MLYELICLCSLTLYQYILSDTRQLFLWREKLMTQNHYNWRLFNKNEPIVTEYAIFHFSWSHGGLGVGWEDLSQETTDSVHQESNHRRIFNTIRHLKLGFKQVSWKEWSRDPAKQRFGEQSKTKWGRKKEGVRRGTWLYYVPYRPLAVDLKTHSWHLPPLTNMNNDLYSYFRYV